jgi:hypothetical protein
MRIGCGHYVLHFGSMRTFVFLPGADLFDTEATLPPGGTVLLLRTRCCCRRGRGRRCRFGNNRQWKGVLTCGFVFLKRRDIFV